MVRSTRNKIRLMVFLAGAIFFSLAADSLENWVDRFNAGHYAFLMHNAP